jgi:hypothetical protein
MNTQVSQLLCDVRYHMDPVYLSIDFVIDLAGTVLTHLSYLRICPSAAAARRARGLHSNARPCRILVMPRLHPPLSFTLERVEEEYIW